MKTEWIPVFIRKKKKVKIPLHSVLLLPFLLQIILVSSLVGYISYRNGQKAVNQAAGLLHSEINARINEYLRNFIETPYRIVQNNAVAVSNGLISFQNQSMMEHYFWEQIQIYKSVSSIYFGSAAGGIADAGRESETGTSFILSTDGFRNGILRKYSTTIQGDRDRQLASIPDFNSRTRPWYKAAVLKGDVTWSDIYILFTGQDMAISPCKPVYDSSRKLLGVVSADLYLSHINRFLSGLDIGKTGSGFIMDKSGLMIASSTLEMIFTRKKPGEVQRRLMAVESSSIVIRAASEALIKKTGSFDRIKTDTKLDFILDGEKNFIQVTSFVNQAGLEWFIVSVISESDFMEEIKTNNRITIILIFISIFISVIIGYFTSLWISDPVSRLNDAVRAVSEGEWPEQPGQSRIAEINELKVSFFQMSGRLKELFDNLTVEIRERKLTEGALRESEEKYRYLIKYSNSIILRIDITGVITYANDYALNFFGYSSDELINKNVVGTIVPPVDRSGRNLEDMVSKLVKNPDLYQRNENENIRKDGSTAWILWSNRGIIDENGKCSEILSIGNDISERRLAELEIKKLLNEKEIILHEVHHRIKNNMNTIAGLLYLQSETIDNAAAVSALKDAQSRVISMMLIYDKLFRSDNFSNVSTKSYLPDLIAGITSTFPDSGRISIKSRIDDYMLDSNILIPVGIIINELLTNSYKHAFTGKKDGLVEISFVNAGNRSFEILFKDNGAGIPDSVLLGESRGFGFSLIYLLTEQMHGTVEVTRSEGTIFRIKFPV